MSLTPDSYRRVTEREYSAHHTLLDIASIQLEIAKKQESGWFNNALITITFSALALEALANAIGDKLWQSEEWKDFESCSPIAKLRLISEKLGIEYSVSQDPWKTVKWLIKFRNKIAHPKPEKISICKEIGQNKSKVLAVDCPESKFEQEITLHNAVLGLKAVKDLKELFCKKIPDHQLDGIATDGWSANTEPIMPHQNNL
jgi:hypothetical protein